MIPILFRIPEFTLLGIHIGPININSFGLMLGLSAIVGSYVLAMELRRRKLNPDIAGTGTVIALVAGVIGAKLLHLIENWDMFLARPSTAFSPSGLTWYGGFILGIAALAIYVRMKHTRIPRFLDALAVALILSYGIGRIGCHLAGDGDYGTPTTLPWGTIYAQGTAKPSVMLREYFDRNPDEREFWHYDSLKTSFAGVDAFGDVYTTFDEVTPCHPTPVYEFLLGILGFFFLKWIWKPSFPDGRLFLIYLVVAGAFRFSVEFLRLQPKIMFGLSEAQSFSVALIAAGLVGILRMPGQRPGGRRTSHD
jgi:phosphatidylglycerol:prolipoprotein diacylglycerol transferase